MGLGIYFEQIDFDILYRIHEIPITNKKINTVEAVKASSPGQNEQSVKRILENNNSRSIYNS